MASLGLAGAVGGAAKGLRSFLSREAEAERAAALQAMETKNRREEAATAHNRDMEKLGVEHENDVTLERLRQEAPNQGQDPAAVATARFLQLPPEQGGLGLSPEEAWAQSRSKTGMSRQDYFGEMAKTYAGAGYDPEQATEMARKITDSVYGGAPGPGSAVSPGPGPAASPGQGAAGFNPTSIEDGISQFRTMYPDIDATDEQIRERLLQKYPDLASASGVAEPPATESPSKPPAAAPGKEMPGEEFSLAGMKSQSTFQPQGGYGADAQSFSDVRDSVSGAVDSARAAVGDFVERGKARQAEIRQILADARGGDTNQESVASAADALQARDDERAATRSAAANAFQEAEDAAAPTAGSDMLAGQYLKLKQIGAKPEEMPREVVEAYASLLPEDHPELPRLMKILQGDAVASR